MLITVILIVIAAITYFLGNINGAVLMSRFVYHSDVRDLGSGNAGLTNFYRSYGTRGMAGVVAIDVVKGVLSALIGGWLLRLTNTTSIESVDFAAVGRLFGTFGVVMGHIMPVFAGFRGGKGILCGVAAIFVVDWRAGLICFVVFAIAVGITRYVSLGSVLGAVSVPISLLAFDFKGIALVLSFICIIPVIIKHIDNMKRILTQTENKLEFKKDVTHKLDSDEF